MIAAQQAGIYRGREFRKENRDEQDDLDKGSRIHSI
jgi:hypothetical protein